MIRLLAICCANSTWLICIFHLLLLQTVDHMYIVGNWDTDCSWRTVVCVVDQPSAECESDHCCWGQSTSSYREFSAATTWIQSKKYYFKESPCFGIWITNTNSDASHSFNAQGKPVGNFRISKLSLLCWFKKKLRFKFVIYTLVE